MWLSVCEKQQIDRWQDVRNIGEMEEKSQDIDPHSTKKNHQHNENQKYAWWIKFYICSQLKEKKVFLLTRVIYIKSNEDFQSIPILISIFFLKFY